MRAIIVRPGTSAVGVEEVPEPDFAEGSLLVQTVGIGICGTDAEIATGKYGWAPPGRDRLILGHESIGRVIEAPSGAELPQFAKGDWVVGIVRRPDPLPCASCGAGEWDMCRNGQYTERGIKERDGYGSERYRIEPAYAVKVDDALGLLGVLLEPTSVVAKAWDHVDRIGQRAHWAPRRVLVVGAGPIGLLAALLAAQRGLDVHVLDRVNEGPKPRLVADLGATYHTGSVKDACPAADVIIECTGVDELVFDAMACVAPGGIVCLTGVSSSGRVLSVDVGALNRELVLENVVVFGSVNANRRHYALAAAALQRADRNWLERLVTRRVPMDQCAKALVREKDDVKVVVTFGQDQ